MRRIIVRRFELVLNITGTPGTPGIGGMPGITHPGIIPVAAGIPGILSVARKKVDKKLATNKNEWKNKK